MWFEFGWTALVAVAILAVVGFPVAWAVGLRGLTAVAVAPPAAITVIGGTAIVAGFVGVPWSVLPVLALTVVGVVILGLLTRRIGAAQVAARTPWAWIAAAVAAAVVAGQVVAAIGAPDNVSQTFDNIFHLNAIRYALEEGTASALEIGHMTNPSGALGFYPAGWHGFVSLVAQLTGADIPVAVTASTLVIAAVIWPLGAVLLARTLFGDRPAALVATGVLAAALPVFPLLLMEYGVLYPYQLGVAMVPAALAVTAGALGVVPRPEGVRPWQLWVVLVALLGGIAIAHPGGFVSWLALSVPLFLALGVRLFAAGSVRTRVLVVVGFLAYLAAGLLLLDVLRPPLDARQWPAARSFEQALTWALTGSPWYGVPAVLATILVAAGVVAVIVRRTVPGLIALGTWLITVILYVVVSSLPQLGDIRDAMTGSWYNNEPRLAALVALGAVLLGAYGADGLVSAAARVLPVGRWPRPAVWAIGAVLALAAVAWTQVGPGTPVPLAVARTAATYAQTDGAALLSTDERELLDRVGEIVPEDEAIAGSPWTGASMAYALSDRQVLMPHTLMEITPEVAAVYDGLRDAQPGDETCEAIEQLRVGYVLDFEPREIHGGSHEYDGLKDLEHSDAVELVDEEGEARLYEVVACEEDAR